MSTLTPIETQKYSVVNPYLSRLSQSNINAINSFDANSLQVSPPKKGGIPLFNNTNGPSWSGLVSHGMDMVGSTILANHPKVNNQSPETTTANAFYDQATQAVSSVSPIWGGVMKAGGFASDALTAAGIGTAQQTTADKILDSKFLKVTPIGLVNSVFTSNTDSFSVDKQALETVGGDYTDLQDDIYEAKEKAGKKYGLFSESARKRTNAFISEVKRKQRSMADIAEDVRDQRGLVDSMGDVASQAYSSRISGGFDPRFLRAKDGGVIETLFMPEFIYDEDEEEDLAYLHDGGTIEGVEQPFTPEFVTITNKLAEGGKMEGPKNVIPDGALHKERHHIENDKGLTKKGVPVVDDDNEQSAEVEREEIIFHKEVTDKIEELYEKYFDEDTSKDEKDQLAIEAGKLIVDEIMFNTDDRAGIIDSLKEGGTLEHRKPSFDVWVKMVDPDFLDESYDFRLAYKKLPFEELEKWRLNPEDNQLPSVIDIDDNTLIFLKKGKTVKDNPELRDEFDFYSNTPAFSSQYKMVFNKKENRWYYKRRAKPYKF